MIHGYHQDNPDPPMPGDSPEFMACPRCQGEGIIHTPDTDPGKTCPQCGGGGYVPKDDYVTCPRCGGQAERDEPVRGLHGDPGELRTVVCESCEGDGVVPADEVERIKREIQDEIDHWMDYAAELEAERRAER